MKRRYHKHSYSPWMQPIKRVLGKFIIPFCIFQGIRTIVIPTIFDVLLLTVFVSIAIAIYFEII